MPREEIISTGSRSLNKNDSHVRLKYKAGLDLKNFPIKPETREEIEFIKALSADEKSKQDNEAKRALERMSTPVDKTKYKKVASAALHQKQPFSIENVIGNDREVLKRTLRFLYEKFKGDIANSLIRKIQVEASSAKTDNEKKDKEYRIKRLQKAYSSFDEFKKYYFSSVDNMLRLVDEFSELPASTNSKRYGLALKEVMRELLRQKDIQRPDFTLNSMKQVHIDTVQRHSRDKNLHDYLVRHEFTEPQHAAFKRAHSPDRLAEEIQDLEMLVLMAKESGKLDAADGYAERLKERQNEFKELRAQERKFPDKKIFLEQSRKYVVLRLGVELSESSPVGGDSKTKKFFIDGLGKWYVRFIERDYDDSKKKYVNGKDFIIAYKDIENFLLVNNLSVTSRTEEEERSRAEKYELGAIRERLAKEYAKSPNVDFDVNYADTVAEKTIVHPDQPIQELERDLKKIDAEIESANKKPNAKHVNELIKIRDEIRNKLLEARVGFLKKTLADRKVVNPLEQKYSEQEILERQFLVEALCTEYQNLGIDVSQFSDDELPKNFTELLQVEHKMKAHETLGSVVSSLGAHLQAKENAAVEAAKVTKVENSVQEPVVEDEPVTNPEESVQEHAPVPEQEETSDDAPKMVEVRAFANEKEAQITLTKYLIADGKPVVKGDKIAEFMTLAGPIKWKAPEEGIIHFTVAEGSTLKTGDQIAYIEIVEGVPEALENEEEVNPAVEDRPIEAKEDLSALDTNTRWVAEILKTNSEISSDQAAKLFANVLLKTKTGALLKINEIKKNVDGKLMVHMRKIDGDQVYSKEPAEDILKEIKNPDGRYSVEAKNA